MIEMKKPINAILANSVNDANIFPVIVAGLSSVKPISFKVYTMCGNNDCPPEFELSAKNKPIEFKITITNVAANKTKNEKYDSFRLRTSNEICEKNFRNFRMRKKRSNFTNRKKRKALSTRKKRISGSNAIKSNNADGEKTHSRRIK
ncbi:hypothetical protein J2Z29_002439 [Treponema pedis]